MTRVSLLSLVGLFLITVPVADAHGQGGYPPGYPGGGSGGGGGGGNPGGGGQPEPCYFYSYGKVAKCDQLSSVPLTECSECRPTSNSESVCDTKAEQNIDQPGNFRQTEVLQVPKGSLGFKNVTVDDMIRCGKIRICGYPNQVCEEDIFGIPTCSMLEFNVNMGPYPRLHGSNCVGQ
jgi:hypothetical protein